LELNFGRQVGKRPSLFTAGATIHLYEFWLRTSGVWRLDRPGHVLCSSEDEMPRGSTARLPFVEIEGQRVVEAELTPPAGDVKVLFESGHVFRIFACVPEGACGGDYFFIHDADGQKESFQVGPRGYVDLEWPRTASG